MICPAGLHNEIIVARSRGIGVLTPEVAIDCSLSGPMLRGSGVAWDIRKADPYCVYDKLDFDICVGTDGDAYDRFLVRLAEMRQSIHIVEQCLEMMPEGPVHSQITTATAQPGGAPSAPLAIRVPAGEAYGRIESPRGELGYYIVSDGGPAPYRFHIRSPSLINLTPLREMAIGTTVADAIVILGHNDDPPRPGAGSAIFLHVARDDYAPTQGCVALARPDLLTLLRGAGPGTRVCVEAGYTKENGS